MVKGIQTLAAKKGAPPAIPKVVEDMMAKKLMLLIENHMYIKLVNLPILAREICITLGIKRLRWIAGKKWQRNFFKRHPELAARVGGKISRARSLNFNVLTHAEWYAAIKPLVEFYPAKTLEKTKYSSAVYAPTADQLERARKVGELAGKMELEAINKDINAHMMGKISGASLVLDPLSDKAKEERIELAGKKRKAGPAVPEPTDEKERAKYFLEQHSYTSESRALKMAASQKAKEEEEAAKVAKKAADANKKQKKLEDEEMAAKDRAEKKKAIQERKAVADAEKEARALAKQAAKAKKAAKAAGKVLKKKQPAQPVLKAAPEEPLYGPPKNKRVKKM